MTREQDLQYRAEKGLTGSDREFGVQVKQETHPVTYRESGRSLRLALAVNQGLDGWEAQYEQTQVPDSFLNMPTHEANMPVTESANNEGNSTDLLAGSNTNGLAQRDRAHVTNRPQEVRNALQALTDK